MGIFGKKSTADSSPKAAIEALLGTREKVASGGAIKEAAQELRPSETPLFAATGFFNDLIACLVCTDQRIVIGAKSGLTDRAVHVLDYATIDRVDVGSSMKGHSVTMFHGSQESKLDRSPNKELAKIRDIVTSQRGAMTPAAATAPADSVEQLAKLAELHAAGVLTDDEFAAAKAKALGI